MEPFQLLAGAEDASLLPLQPWCERYGLTAGFSSRQAGNTALHVGDDAEAVVQRRTRIAGGLGWRFEAWTCAEQVHGCEVRVVAGADIGRGRVLREDAIQHTDALVTNEPDVLLAMFFADCVPLYFYDPVTESIGLAHAGWKGTVLEVAVRTVERMNEAFGAKPENMLAAIGPSIGGCCYEVDERVLERVRPLLSSLGQEHDYQAEDGVLRDVSEGRAQLDLKLLNRHLMIKAGILPSRIELSTWCTGCRTDLFFSHRTENGGTGRMMSFLGRKSR